MTPYTAKHFFRRLARVGVVVLVWDAAYLLFSAFLWALVVTLFRDLTRRTTVLSDHIARDDDDAVKPIFRPSANTIESS